MIRWARIVIRTIGGWLALSEFLLLWLWLWEERADLTCSEFFPGSEAPKPPPREEDPRLLGEGLQKWERPHRATVTDRGRGRRIVVTPVLRREDANLGSVPGPFAEAVVPTSAPKRKRKRTISQRELRDLTKNDDDETDSLRNPRKRSRKPPRRYGQGE